MKKNKKFDLNLMFPFIVTFFSGLITHCSILWLEAISPDALVTGNFKVAGAWELSLGRWGIHFIDQLRGGIVNEAIILLFSMILLGLTTLIICKIFNIKNKFLIVIISLIISTSPQISETLMFIYCADSYCLSMLLSVLSVYFIIKGDNNKINIIFAVLCIIFSLSLYQAYISVSISLIVIYIISSLLNSELKTKEIIYKLLKYLLIVFVSMCAYFAITKLIMLLSGVDFAQYKGANEMSIKTIVSNLKNTIPSTFDSLYGYLFREDIIYNKYWNRQILNILLLSLFSISLIYLYIKSNKIDLPKKIFSLILMMIFPLCINLMNIIMPATRINIVTGPALICVYLIIILIVSNIDDYRFIKCLKYCICFLLLILCYTNIMADNATYFARNEVYQNYYTISNDILSQVNSLDNYQEGMKWCFTDNIRFKSQYSLMSNGNIANDYETWDNVDGIWSSWAFYHRYLGTDLYMVDKEEYFDIVFSDSVKNMPIYPSNGSIKIIDDRVIIKLSDNGYSK